MPIPTIPDKNGHHETDREKLLAKSEWCVEARNFKEIGEALSSFSRITDTYEFVGSAEVKLEGTVRRLEIILCVDEEQRFMCDVCHRVPTRPTSENPGICTMCGKKVCSICWKDHERKEWRPPVKSIDGTPF